jgi:hypothetical protein
MAAEKNDVYIPEDDIHVKNCRQAEKDLKEAQTELERLEAAKMAASETLLKISRTGIQDYKATMLIQGKPAEVPNLQDSTDKAALQEKIVEKRREILNTVRGKFSRAVQEDPRQRARWRQIIEKEALAQRLTAEAAQERMDFVGALRKVGCTTISEVWLNGEAV